MEHYTFYFARLDWSNPWIVGIGTAVISGVLLSLINRFVLRRKNDKDIRMRIDSANSEVIYALRPSVSEGSMPDKKIVEALLRATARKHALPEDSLMTTDEFAEQLIKEVMDSTFLSHDQKIKHCESIAQIISNTSKNKGGLYEQIRYGTNDPYYDYRRKVDSQNWFITAPVAIITSLVLTASRLPDGDIKNVLKIITTVFLIMLVIILIPKIYDIVTGFLVSSREKHRK